MTSGTGAPDRPSPALSDAAEDEAGTDERSTGPAAVVPAATEPAAIGPDAVVPDAVVPDAVGPDAVVPAAVPLSTPSAPPQEGDLPEWAWVERWRRTGEEPAVAPGVALAFFAAFVVAVAILTLSEGMARFPLVAVAANVVIAAGLTPALWYSRALPVLRWVAVGVVAGLLAGWVGALVA